MAATVEMRRLPQRYTVLGRSGQPIGRDLGLKEAQKLAGKTKKLPYVPDERKWACKVKLECARRRRQSLVGPAAMSKV